MLVDTHCHLNDASAFPDPAATIAEAHAAGVGRLIVVGIDEESSRRALDLADAHPSVYAVVGWHPNSAATFSPAGLDEIATLLAHPKALALGEIGLDYHWDFASRDQQARALTDQLDLAQELDVPVVFHCRKAYPDLLAILEARGPHRYLFHCFSGDSADARRAEALGAYFGVDGPVTYPKADSLRHLLRGLPRDRIMIETDSPWMAPHPHRGKPNRPAWLPYVNEALATTLGLSPADAATLTTANARRFFVGLG